MIKTKAAVLHEIGGKLAIEDILVREPGPGQVLVRMIASGICHTDEAVRKGVLLGPDYAPSVLGHEGAGIIEKVGEGVTSLKPGDHVAMTYASCGECEYCKKGQTANCKNFVPLNFGGMLANGTAAYQQDGQDVRNFFGMSSFGMMAVVSETSCLKVPENADLSNLAPFGCGILTGSGTIVDFLGATEEDSVAVYGCGAVGFAGIMAARAIGCKNVIAIGGNQYKLDIAMDIGATHVINRKVTPDLEAEIRKICPNGVECQMDTSGAHNMIQTALNSMAMGGRIACVAVMEDPVISVDVMKLLYANGWIGSVQEGGSNKLERLRWLVDLYLKGEFPVDKLITKYDYSDINQAFDDLNAGKVIKAVLQYPAE